MAGGIFISYRRSDSAATVGRIYDRLVAHFGPAQIFKDVDSIPVGADFHSYIDGVIARSAVALVIIGPQWTDAQDAAGRKRLFDPADVVRQEVEAALRRGVVVIPVLVEGAIMPGAGQVPPSLADLTGRNGVQIRYDPDFDGDMRRLVAVLERWVPTWRPVPAAGASGPQSFSHAPAATSSPSRQSLSPRQLS